jgi:hypothetical protein
MAYNFWEEQPLPSHIIYFVPLCGDYIQMSLFLGTPSGSPKIGTFVVPKLWTFIYFSNQIYFESVRKISYIPWIYISNNVYHALIEPRLTPTFKGCMVRSQFFNLNLAFFFIKS